MAGNAGTGSRGGSRETAEELYAGHLAALDAGEERDLDELCARHPELAAELRELDRDLRRVERALPRPGPEPGGGGRADGPGATPGAAPDAPSGAPSGSTGTGGDRGSAAGDPARGAAEGPVSASGELGEEAEVSVDPQGPGQVLEELARLRGSRVRYRPHGEIAHGGMGAVLRVWDPELRRELAMKLLTSPGGDPQAADRALSRFLEEAQVTGQLDHPGIVPVHEMGLDDRGRVYFTMKLVRGRDLRRVFELAQEGKGEWTLARVLEVLLRVCDALSYAHAKGVIHRDVKPANVMVGRFGEVYLMDWGLARVAGHEDSRDLRLDPSSLATLRELRTVRGQAKASGTSSPLVTMDGTIVGTPYFMSPEQAEGRLDAVGPTSDVYGAGTLLYQLLTGRIPYHREGSHASPHTILAMVLQGPPEPVSRLAPDAPAELVAICEKAMARDPAERYADASEMGEDLRRFLEGRVVRAYEEGAVAELRKWVARNRPLAATAAAAVLLVLGGSIGWSTVLAGKNEDLREASRLARDSRAAAERERNEVLRLADGLRARELVERAESELWPALPERVGELERWLADARALAGRLPLHRAALEELRASALERSDEEILADRAVEERARLDRLRLLETHVELLHHGRDSYLDEELFDPGWSQPPTAEHVELHLPERTELTRAEVFDFPRLTWRFADDEAAWRHGLLATLVATAERLVEESPLEARIALPPAERDGGLVAAIETRISTAREIGERTLTGPAARSAWNGAITSIADRDECPAYGGLEIAPQAGLLPLGRDPHSGLWEFAALFTGEPPPRTGSGRVSPTPESALVLVLVPGGEYAIGCQADDPTGPHHDPRALPIEGPVHHIALDPFFIAKHEVTQEQWMRIGGGNPSTYRGRGLRQMFDAGRAMHPVESVSWFEAREALARVDLSLPTEAQWEAACRGGTTTPWHTGAELSSLNDRENVADGGSAAEMARLGAPWFASVAEAGFHDGAALHADVGGFAPNPFGLHDVLGNVSEWCEDSIPEGIRRYAGVPRAGDGLRGLPFARKRVVRGGNFQVGAADARSGRRSAEDPDVKRPDVGVRPARRLDPRAADS